MRGRYCHWIGVLTMNATGALSTPFPHGRRAGRAKLVTVVCLLRPLVRMTDQHCLPLTAAVRV